MFSKMPQHVAFFYKSFTAIRTAVWSFVRMRAPMRDQVTFAHKIFWTKITSERSFRITAFVMGSHMEQEISFKWKTLSTFGTNEGTFAGMTSHMVDEVFLSGKWFGTDVTAVRRFAGMLAKMIIEMFFSSKGPLAELASVR